MGVQAPNGAMPAWSAWRTVGWLGVVSLAADMVYEGARSITGPYLASLGASALLVGLVTGAGEAAALGFRLWTGPLADRSGRYWSLAILGYGMTAVSVPLMAVAPFVGGAGLVVASTLVLAERVGKAVRSPAKSVLLAHAARSVGRGRGFGVHKALDQVGSFSGPLLVAVLIATTGRTWFALAALAVPAALAMWLLFWIRARVPDLATPDDPAAAARERTAHGATDPEGGVDGRLSGDFYLFSAACAALTLGLMTFGVISFHLVDDDLVTAAVVPLVYAAGMAAAAVAALGTGWTYDRAGPGVLLALPLLVGAVPPLVFSGSVEVVVAGILLWGVATGVLESTVKALVADLVPRERLGTAYGTFAAVMGVAALAGGGLAGWLYADGVTDLTVVVAVVQLVALGLLVRVLRSARHQRATS